MPLDFSGHLDAIQRVYLWLPIVWVIGLAVLLPVTWFIRRTWLASRPAEESPELILKRRYARGEIDRDEYRALLDDLRS